MFKDFKTLYQQAIDYVVSHGAKPTDFNPGSVWSVILEATAALVEECYQLIARLMRMFWISTASGQWLDLRAADFGKTRKAGHAAKLIITIGRNAPAPFGILIPSGTTWEADGVRYVTTVDATIYVNTSNVDVPVVAVAIGSAANKAEGTKLQQVGQGVAGIEWATIKTIVEYGADVESDDDFRARVLDWLRHPGTSGNNANYRQWAMDVHDVTGVRVVPTWAGPGTVKVIILGPDKKPPTPGLVATVQEKIAPADEMSETRLAPIGATVTVVGALPVIINVDATVLLDSATSVAMSTIQQKFSLAMAAYLGNMALKADTVRYARVGSLLMDQDGVLDFVSYSVNGGASNILIATDQVAVLGTVTLRAG